MESEKRAMLDCLEDQRSHVVGILDGLSEDALRRPVLPSGWSCLKLVRHLAVDVERFWFRIVTDGQKLDEDPGDESDTGWTVPADTSAIEVFDLYRK